MSAWGHPPLQGKGELMNEKENRLVSVVEHWLPRMEVAGIPSTTAKAIIDRVGVWENWLQTWVAEGERHFHMAETALLQDRLITAGEAYVRASLLHHFGQFMAFENLAEKTKAAVRKVELYRMALPLLDPPGAIVEVPFEGQALKGVLRLPVGMDRAPLALIVPGSDSTKEEFPALERHFHTRGIATLSLDGPGQGEGRLFGPLRPDITAAINATVNEISDHPRLNGLYGLVGVAFGGHLALRAAGAENLCAVVSINGFFDLGDFWQELPNVYHDNMRFSLGSDDTVERASRFTLKGCGTLPVPALILHGGRDRIFPPREAERCLAIAPEGSQLAVFADGNHVCNNISWQYRPLVADWLSECFRERSPKPE